MLPTLNPETAFAITALSGWSLVGLLWVVGRNYPRQGVGWIMASLTSVGGGYMLFALSQTLPTIPTTWASYVLMSLGSSLASLGLRRFLACPWSAPDRALLALPWVLPLLWWTLSQGDFAQVPRLNSTGLVLQLCVLCTILWRGRQSIVGNGWKVMLAGAVVQGLSVLPFVLPGAPPSTVAPVATSTAEQVVAWVLCIMMFLNLQLSVVSFLLMLQDRRVDQERQAAEIDVLTQLPNRRRLERQLAALLPLLQRQGSSMAVMLLDIDHFKQVNDRYGHAAGDSVLQQVAQVLQGEVRQGELLARYGGEEFVLALPFTDKHQAAQAAQRIVQAVADMPILIEGQHRPVTISAGVHLLDWSKNRALAAGIPALLATWEQALEQADMAMYQAKCGGRNRYVLSSLETPTPPENAPHSVAA